MASPILFLVSWLATTSQGSGPEAPTQIELNVRAEDTGNPLSNARGCASGSERGVSS